MYLELGFKENDNCKKYKYLFMSTRFFLSPFRLFNETGIFLSDQLQGMELRAILVQRDHENGSIHILESKSCFYFNF